MSTVARVAGAAVIIATVAVIVAGSHGRIRAFPSSDAMVRVSWSARPERIERCVRVSAEELEQTPVHMRREIVCEGTTARYRLEVDRDGQLVDSVTVQGGGLQHDREVYVSREISVPAAESRLTVRFVRVDSSVTSGGVAPADSPAAPPTTASSDSTEAGALAERGVRESQELERRRAEAIPAVLVLDTTVTLAERSVILVTYDPLLRRLVTKSGPR